MATNTLLYDASRQALNTFVIMMSCIVHFGNQINLFSKLERLLMDRCIKAILFRLVYNFLPIYFVYIHYDFTTLLLDYFTLI